MSSSAWLRVASCCLVLLCLLQVTLSYSPRGPYRSLALVKRPSEQQPLSDDDLEMALQSYEPDFAEWGRRFPDSAQYFGLLDRLVKKKDNSAQDQPKRTGNRKFQTQGWR